MIRLPRSVLEQLVDPEKVNYMSDRFCLYCECAWQCSTDLPYRDVSNHAVDCPIRIVQEALARTQERVLTQDEMQRAATEAWKEQPAARFFWSPGHFQAWPDDTGRPVCEQIWNEAIEVR